MPKYDEFIFAPYEGIDRDKYLLAIYSLQADTSDAIDLAQALVVEQTTGTWTAVPGETKDVKERSSGRVLGLYEIPDYERELPKDAPPRRFVIVVAYPIVNINGQFPELLTTLYGNVSMIGKLKLLDVMMPPPFLKAFKGPKFGIEGIRKLLKIEKRPVLCGMYKPCVGALPEALGKMAYEMSVGGVDVLKDDELLADPEFCPLEARVEVTRKSLDRAEKETGRKSIYCVNVTDRPQEMYRKARKAVENGASALLVNVFTVGYAAAQDLTEDPAITVPVMGHPAFAGTYFEAPDYGMLSHLALGKFVRMSGCDFIIYPSPFGKVPLMRDRAVRIAQELRAPMGHLKSVFPGPAAGMHPGNVARSLAEFGLDMVVGAGGGLHGHPGGTIAGGRAMHQAMEAFMNGVPVDEAAKKNKELKAALEKWGGEGGEIYSLLR